jgi:carbon storage regulator
MLVLTRKSHEQIQIGDNITVTVLRVKGGAVRIGVDAPRNVSVLRKELEGTPRKNKPSDVEAAATSPAQCSKAPIVAVPRRWAAKGAASALSGGKKTSIATRLIENPKRSRLFRTAPLGSYLVGS